MHTVNWFQVLLFNTNSFICTLLNGFRYCYVIPIIQFKSLVHTQLNGFKLSKWSNRSLWPIDGTLTGTSTPGQSESGNNDNDGVFQIHQSSQTGASASDTV